MKKKTSTPKVTKKGGKLTYKARKKLPDSAFALPEERKYPLKVKKNGKFVLSCSHANSAKGYSTKEEERGNLSKNKEVTIKRKANDVLKKCKKNAKSKKK